MRWRRSVGASLLGLENARSTSVACSATRSTTQPTLMGLTCSCGGESGPACRPGQVRQGRGRRRQRVAGLFLSRRGDRLVTRPIKGTAATREQMLPKDHAENIMIVDLMRNDLSGVCWPGTVSVDALCAFEDHPGLVHLVSTVSGRLRDGATWRDVFAATYPPGSVSGAPKSSALTAITDLETSPRGPYCGAIGWVDADNDEAELAVGIRTFWAERDGAGRRWLRFGTGWHPGTRTRPANGPRPSSRPRLVGLAAKHCEPGAAVAASLASGSMGTSSTRPHPPSRRSTTPSRSATASSRRPRSTEGDRSRNPGTTPVSSGRLPASVCRRWISPSSRRASTPFSTVNRSTLAGCATA